MSGIVLVPVLYRIVRADPPTVEDFTAPMMLGRRPRRIEREHPEEWTGLSMFDTPERARAAVREYPSLGSFVATLRLDLRLVIARQIFGPGHYTVWGPPAVLLSAVVFVEPV